MSEKFPVSETGEPQGTIHCKCGYEFTLENQIEEILQVIQRSLTVDGVLC